MALQFEKLEPQVRQMGVALAGQHDTVTEQARQAHDWLARMDDLDAIWAQIMIARKNDAGFRGAGPMDEPINRPIGFVDAPDLATVYASDGSQIYPDPHGPVPYWLTNIGVFVYHHGTDRLPEIEVEPQLFYQEQDVRDREGRLIANAAINARRSVYEMQMLSRAATRRAAEDAMPRIALYDGPLIGMPMGKEVQNAPALTADYHEAMDILWDFGVTLSGYVDRPSSRFVVYTIYLMTLDRDDITRARLESALLEGLTDIDLYRTLLGPGERSGLMIQQSPLNKEYKERYGDHQEIAFFYLNAASAGQEPYLARVEVPMWVARSKPHVNALHGVLYGQCQITDRYPYALTRADEIAVVQPAERRALDERIAIEMLRNQQALAASQKLSSKNLARHGRRQHHGV